MERGGHHGADRIRRDHARRSGLRTDDAADSSVESKSEGRNASGSRRVESASAWREEEHPACHEETPHRRHARPDRPPADNPDIAADNRLQQASHHHALSLRENGDRMRVVTAGTRSLAGLLVVLSACAPAHKPSVCRSCFWEYQPAALKREMIEVYGDRRFDDPLLEAERRMLIATVAGRPPRLSAVSARAAASRHADDTRPRALRRGSAGVHGRHRAAPIPRRHSGCGGRGARVASDLVEGERLHGDRRGTILAADSATQTIERRLPVPKAPPRSSWARARSSCAPDTRVGAQVERTVRDWLSYQLAWDGADRPVAEVRARDLARRGAPARPARRDRRMPSCR